MKCLVNGLSTAVRRAPFSVVLLAVVVSGVLGYLGGGFRPEGDSNASFAPNAPELEAADRIGELFSEEATTSVMQVVITAPAGGSVFSLDGLAAVQAVEKTVRGGSFEDILAESEDPALAAERPAVISFLSPVLGAIAQGQRIPTADAEVQQLYKGALSVLPQETVSLFQQLLPESGDPATAVAEKGLMILITTGPKSSDEYETFADLSALAAKEIEATALPGGVSAEPFSFELLFADSDEFETEIVRLFSTAILIIVLVLAAVFLIVPDSRRARRWMTFGFLGIVVGVGLSILPTLAKILDSVFPDVISNWPSGTIFSLVAVAMLLLFLAWSAERFHLAFPLMVFVGWHRWGTRVVEGNLDTSDALFRALGAVRRIIRFFARIGAHRLLGYLDRIDSALCIRNPMYQKGLRRTSADTLLTIVTIFFAISWMNGVGFLLYGNASPMVQILPILIIGLGVDYSIHVTSRYREELSDGRDVDASVRRAIRTVGIALFLATLTTAVGFLTNLFNPLPALREFGLLAAVGILASFLLMLTFVPAMRELLDRRGMRVGTMDGKSLAAGGSRALPRLISSTSWLANYIPGVVVVVALGLGGVGYYGFTQLETEFSFLDFIPTTSPLRGTFESIAQDFGGGFGESTHILIEGDVATAESWNAMVALNQNLATTENVVTFAGNPAGTSPVAAIVQLAFEEPNVGQALERAGVNPNTWTAPAGGSLASVYEAAFTADQQTMTGVLHRTSEGYDAALFDLTTQAGEAGAGQMREDVRVASAPVVGIGLSAVGTSGEIINDVIVTTLRDSQKSSLQITLIVALVLLVANFFFEARRPMLGVITTLPVVLVVLLSFGIMAGIGIPFGPVTATISALAIGIGIPYMIHITHRYLEDRGRFETIASAITSTLRNTGAALAGSALTTVAGFGILVTSTTIPFRQFGFVTAYTILLAMAAAVLVLPSALVLWDKWHRSRGENPYRGAETKIASGSVRAEGSDHL